MYPNAPCHRPGAVKEKGCVDTRFPSGRSESAFPTLQAQPYGKHPKQKVKTKLITFDMVMVTSELRCLNYLINLHLRLRV